LANWRISALVNWRIDELMKKNGLIIAIDGPAAVGKSTMGKLIARELGFLYIDTGAIYRAITWKVLKNNINVYDEDIISNLVSNIYITIERANSKSLNDYYHIFVDGEDVTEEIRNPRIDQSVSQIARLPKIRKQLMNKGYGIDYEEVKKQIVQRDKIDSKRKYAPLIKAKDAILIDSTEKSIEEVKDIILKIINKYRECRKK
jgi:cytidylate kinase